MMGPSFWYWGCERWEFECWMLPMGKAGFPQGCPLANTFSFSLPTIDANMLSYLLSLWVSPVRLSCFLSIACTCHTTARFHCAHFYNSSTYSWRYMGNHEVPLPACRNKKNRIKLYDKSARKNLNNTQIYVSKYVPIKNCDYYHDLGETLVERVERGAYLASKV